MFREFFTIKNTFTGPDFKVGEDLEFGTIISFFAEKIDGEWKFKVEDMSLNGHYGSSRDFTFSSLEEMKAHALVAQKGGSIDHLWKAA